MGLGALAAMLGCAKRVGDWHRIARHALHRAIQWLGSRVPFYRAALDSPSRPHLERPPGSRFVNQRRLPALRLSPWRIILVLADWYISRYARALTVCYPVAIVFYSGV